MIHHKLLETLEEDDFRLSVRGELLDVTGPVERLTDEQRMLIREHKQALIAILNARQIGSSKPADVPTRDTAEVNPPLPLNGATQARLPLPKLSCSNCGSTKLEPRVYTSVCHSCGQIDERCPGCDMVMRDSDITCRGCGRSLI